MEHSLEEVKKIIKKFIEESTASNIAIQGKGLERFFANKDIYEIESHLVEIGKQYNINARIDNSIFSKNILANFKSVDPVTAFIPVQYQYNFLHHLAKSYSTGKDLHELIDEFITAFKDQFKLADIVITASGATRCKTNLRFALNSLRDYGLVVSRDKNGRRSWSPSVIGLITLLNIQLCKPESFFWPNYREPDSLYVADKKNQSLGAGTIDPLLWHSLYQFRTPTHIYRFLSWQQSIALNDAEKVVLNDILDRFIEFTHKGLVITKTGISESKKFKVLSEQFQRKLYTQQDSYPELLDKLFGHFKHIK